jgi:hypothetical protein
LARDVITPGEINSQEAIQNNNFPLFSTDSRGLVFRYMRYWIEVAYSKLEIAQPEAITKTLDIIDNFFSEPENTVRFKMKKGDIIQQNLDRWCVVGLTFKQNTSRRESEPVKVQSTMTDASLSPLQGFKLTLKNFRSA